MKQNRTTRRINSCAGFSFHGVIVLFVALLQGCAHTFPKADGKSDVAPMQATFGEASISEEQKKNDSLPANLYDPDPQVWKNNRRVFVNTHGELKAKLSGPIQSLLVSLPGEVPVSISSAESFEKDGIKYLAINFYSADEDIDFKKEYRATAVSYSAEADVYEVTLPVAEVLKASLDPRIRKVGQRLLLRPDLRDPARRPEVAPGHMVLREGA